MRHFFEWFAERRAGDRPWLILGKGPTFARRSEYDLASYRLLSLNHVARELPVDLAHMIDLDVVEACADALLGQAGAVVLPWYPHVNNAPGPRSLGDLAGGHPLLRRLSSEGRLLWYDLSTSPRRYGPGPVVRATYFSAEAAVELLALAGVSRVRSLGVDGGGTYSGEFRDIQDRTLLANSRSTFDLQFEGIARTILRTGVEFAPLTLPSPVVLRVVGGTGEALPARVAEYSARKRTSMTVAVEGPEPAPQERQQTGFRAIVLSARALVLDDLRKLWARPIREGIEVPEGDAPPLALVAAGERHRFTMLCDDAAAMIAGGERARTAQVTLPPRWGRSDRLESGGASILGYHAPHTRPWVSRAHPLAHLWVAELLEAVREGHVPAELVAAEARAGQVRPSLVAQVREQAVESLFLSRAARRSDRRFSPPGATPAVPGWWSAPGLIARALAREVRRRLRDYRLRRLRRSVP